MGTKTLKLKSRLTEAEAASLLSSLIGEDVTVDDLASYAKQGIIPAYLTMNQAKFPGSTLCLVEAAEYLSFDKRDMPGRTEKSKTPNLYDQEFRAWQKEVPYPLELYNSSDDQGRYDFQCARDSEGVIWVVFAGIHHEGYPSGGGPLERIREEHWVRVYTPQVISKVASILNDVNAYPNWPAVPHGRTIDDGKGEFQGCEDDWVVPLVSPYDHGMRDGKPIERPAPAESQRLDPRERDTYSRILFVLAKKAGLKLERLGADEKLLVEYAAREGLPIPTGKGTIERKLLAAKLLAQQNFLDS